MPRRLLHPLAFLILGVVLVSTIYDGWQVRGERNALEGQRDSLRLVLKAANAAAVLATSERIVAERHADAAVARSERARLEADTLRDRVVVLEAGRVAVTDSTGRVDSVAIPPAVTARLVADSAAVVSLTAARDSLIRATVTLRAEVASREVLVTLTGLDRDLADRQVAEARAGERKARRAAILWKGVAVAAVVVAAVR